MPLVVESPHKLWTREDCQALEQAGPLNPRHYELLDGELIQRRGKQQPHMRSVWLVVEWLRQVFGSRFVAQEPAIDVRPEDNPTSDPEPDTVVLNRPFVELASRAQPADIRLIVEVAGSSLAVDLSLKRSLYARACIPEYWVVDLDGRRLVVHRDPRDGDYRSVIAYAENETAAPAAAPEAGVRVGELL